MNRNYSTGGCLLIVALLFLVSNEPMAHSQLAETVDAKPSLLSRVKVGDSVEFRYANGLLFVHASGTKHLDGDIGIKILEIHPQLIVAEEKRENMPLRELRIPMHAIMAVSYSAKSKSN